MVCEWHSTFLKSDVDGCEWHSKLLQSDFDLVGIEGDMSRLRQQTLAHMLQQQGLQVIRS
jgi:hypothetical protein